MSDFNGDTAGDSGRPPMEYDHTQWDGAERAECPSCGFHTFENGTCDDCPSALPEPTPEPEVPSDAA